MDSNTYALLLTKIPQVAQAGSPLSAAGEGNGRGGKLFVRKDGVIVKSATKPRGVHSKYTPACTVCLDSCANLEYDELCKKVKVRQYCRGLSSKERFFVCLRHRDIRPDFVQRGVHKTTLLHARPHRVAFVDLKSSRKIYRCVLCPGPLGKRKDAQSTLGSLLCHGCFIEAVQMPECPQWIRDIRRAKACPSCFESKPHTQAGEKCMACKKLDKYEPDEEVMASIRKLCKPLERTPYALKLESQMI